MIYRQRAIEVSRRNALIIHHLESWNASTLLDAYRYRVSKPCVVAVEAWLDRAVAATTVAARAVPIITWPPVRLRVSLRSGKRRKVDGEETLFGEAHAVSTNGLIRTDDINALSALLERLQCAGARTSIVTLCVSVVTCLTEKAVLHAITANRLHARFAGLAAVASLVTTVCRTSVAVRCVLVVALFGKAQEVEGIFGCWILVDDCIDLAVPADSAVLLVLVSRPRIRDRMADVPCFTPLGRCFFLNLLLLFLCFCERDAVTAFCRVFRDSSL